MNNPLGVTLVEGIREPHEANKNPFDLGGNRTHDLRIIPLPLLISNLVISSDFILTKYKALTWCFVSGNVLYSVVAGFTSALKLLVLWALILRH